MTAVPEGMTLTQHLGNCESLKIDVTVAAGTQPKETAAAAIDRVHGLVEAKLEEKMKKALEDLKG